MRRIFQSFKCYASCKGRASRWEFAFFALFALNCFLLSIAVVLYSVNQWTLLTALVLLLFSQTCMLLVSVRRLHDTGRRGWLAVVAYCLVLLWLALAVYGVVTFDIGRDESVSEWERIADKFFGFIEPFLLKAASAIMAVVMLYLGFSKGQEGENKYGLAPN